MKYKIICSGFDRYLDDIVCALDRYSKRYSDDCSLESLIDDITSGRYEVWVILDADTESFAAVCITFHDIQQKRVVVYDLCGTGGLNLVECLKFAEEEARSRGAEKISIFGRVAWGRKLRGLNYKTHVVEYRKGLCDGEKQAGGHKTGTESDDSATVLD